MKKFLKKYPHTWTLLYFIIYLVWFYIIEHRINFNYHIIGNNIDKQIPFIPIFVIPYFLWFAYIGGAFTYNFFYDKKNYTKLCIFIFSGMTIFLIISTLYPNGHTLRPNYIPNDNICNKLINYLYKIDTPTNIFPSIHVYNSIGAHLSILNSKKLKNNKIIKTSSFFLMISIICATVLIKQHTLLDVLSAFILAFIMIPITYFIDWDNSFISTVTKGISKTR